MAIETKLKSVSVEAIKVIFDYIIDKLNLHTNNSNNPHNVTKIQVGLGNVDNTSDEDKPVSTAQKSAIEQAKSDMNEVIERVGSDIESKIDVHSNSKNNPHEVTVEQIGAVSTEHLSKVRIIYPATIGTVWDGASAPYTQEVSVPGLREDDKEPTVYLMASEDVQTAEAEEGAFGVMYRFEALDDILKVLSYEKTDCSINVEIEVFRL